MQKSLAVWFAALTLAGIGCLADAKSRPKQALVKEVSITVTSEGFQPAEIKMKRGQRLRLVVTRKVERTCVTEIVIKDLKIEQQLPLDQPVIVELTPTKAGELRFACAMDMIGGKVIVE